MRRVPVGRFSVAFDPTKGERPWSVQNKSGSGWKLRTFEDVVRMVGKRHARAAMKELHQLLGSAVTAAGGSRAIR